MSQQIFAAWQKVIPSLTDITAAMQQKTIIAVGALPYLRITPAIFLDRYEIYCVKDVADLDVLRDYVKITSLEEYAPKVAARVQSTNYLLGNYVFQGFLKSRRHPFRLLLNQTTPPIIQKLTELKIDWLGNQVESFSDVHTKGSFRQVIKQLGLPHLPDHQLSRQEFVALTFQQVNQWWQKPVVVQRADLEVGGVSGTFFVHSATDLKNVQEAFRQDTRFATVQVSPFIEGYSTSMLGCVTHLGILTSALQLQLVDVPETMPGMSPSGSFNGHDWGFTDWPEDTEKQAQKIVEAVGQHLAHKGYKGIFGLDFMYDKSSQQIIPIECNPRPTGALPVQSLMIIKQGQVPPLDFFHLMSHLNIRENFDFNAINQALKQRSPLAHLSLNPTGVYSMKLNLKAGIYSYNPTHNRLHYRRPGAFPWEIHQPDEFIIIDSVARPNQTILQTVPRFFKIIFPRSIATSSNSIQPKVGQLVSALGAALRRHQTTS